MDQNTTKKPILVIGGGISGITTAVEAAECGREVVLVERQPYLGGNVVKFNQYFPKLCPPVCGLEINFRRIKNNLLIKLFTSTTVTNITGSKGNYKVVLSTSPAFINENCTSCGECEKVCPEERENDFNLGMDKTKAIYLPHEMALPWKYTIDEASCKKESCKKCVDVCKYNAIDLGAKATEITLEVSSVVNATGWDLYDASKIDNLGLSSHPDIITNLMMERLGAPNGPTKGKIQRLTDGQAPKKVAFLQCAGSRDKSHQPYCSGVCCSASLKQALYVNEQIPDCEIKIFYIDLRVSGRNEDFLKKVETTKNISLVKGKAAKTAINSENKIDVTFEDMSANKRVTESFDLVILATGITPGKELAGFSQTDKDGFYTSVSDNGIISTGCAMKPMDVSSSVKSATGAALKAIQID